MVYIDLNIVFISTISVEALIIICMACAIHRRRKQMKEELQLSTVKYRRNLEKKE